MRSKKLTVWIASLFVIGGCGVHVGNSMKSNTYASAQGYSVNYSPDLTLQETAGGEAVHIDNRSLVNTGKDEQISGVMIHVSPASSVRNVEDLKALAVDEHANREFTEKVIPGGTALVAKQGVPERGENYSAIYYFLTQKGKLIRASADAQAPGRGLELIPPILESFNAN